MGLFDTLRPGIWTTLTMEVVYFDQSTDQYSEMLVAVEGVNAGRILGRNSGED